MEDQLPLPIEMPSEAAEEMLNAAPEAPIDREIWFRAHASKLKSAIHDYDRGKADVEEAMAKLKEELLRDTMRHWIGVKRTGQKRHDDAKALLAKTGLAIDEVRAMVSSWSAPSAVPKTRQVRDREGMLES